MKKVPSRKVYSWSRLDLIVGDLLLYLLMKRSRRICNTNGIDGPRFIHAHDFIGHSINVFGGFEEEYINYAVHVLSTIGVEKSCFVDVGANIGNHALKIGRNFGKVICVEPALPNYQLLKLNCACAKYVHLRFALHSEEGEGLLLIDKTNKGGSKVISFNAKGSSCERLEADADNYTQEVKLTTLDRLLDGEDKVDLIKLDVEGSELSVLMGGLLTLSKFKPAILFEQNSWDTTNAFNTAAHYLESLGYKFILLSDASLHEPRPKIAKVFLALMRLIKGSRIKVQHVDKVVPTISIPMIIAYYPR